MSNNTSLPQCGHECPWKCTALCLRELLTSERLSEDHASLAVLSGLKHHYGDSGLPPCVSSSGAFDWQPDFAVEMAKGG